MLCTHDVLSPRIHPGLDGVRIGQLSDIHVRIGFKPRVLHAAVEMINALQPDFVALTGDYVCLSHRPLPQLTAALQKLTVPAYAILGNHDHWTNARKVRQALDRARVDVLTNEHRLLEVGAGTLYLVGLDDSVTGHDDPPAAFRGPFVSKKVGIKYLSGFFDIHGSLLYVTRGLGASVPVRFRAPLEVAILTLRSASRAIKRA